MGIKLSASICSKSVKKYHSKMSTKTRKSKNFQFTQLENILVWFSNPENLKAFREAKFYRFPLIWKWFLTIRWFSLKIPTAMYLFSKRALLFFGISMITTSKRCCSIFTFLSKAELNPFMNNIFIWKSICMNKTTIFSQGLLLRILWYFSTARRLKKNFAYLLLFFYLST